MPKDEIKNYVINKSATFDEIYKKFYNNNNYLLDTEFPYNIDFLAVIDDIGQLVGVIDKIEMARALADANCSQFSADEICNTNFSSILESDDCKEKCLEIFHKTCIRYIPIVTKDSILVDIISRFDFLEFRITSYSQFGEDIVLENALYDVDKIFYLDVGAFDPWAYSVTKWHYSAKFANGINVEPQEKYYQFLCKDRSRDINLNIALGEQEGKTNFYSNLGASTILQKYTTDDSISMEVPIKTLRQICDEYVPLDIEIHFLKIDVEGYEKNVLLGADFNEYRPWIIIIEATKPCTMIPTQNEWEYILSENNYTFANQYGVNRFYVANEKNYLLERFVDMHLLNRKYMIFKNTYCG